MWELLIFQFQLIIMSCKYTTYNRSISGPDLENTFLKIWVYWVHCISFVKIEVEIFHQGLQFLRLSHIDPVLGLFLSRIALQEKTNLKNGVIVLTDIDVTGVLYIEVISGVWIKQNYLLACCRFSIIMILQGL